MQQYAAAAAWVRQGAACVGGAAGVVDGGTIAMDGRQPACVRQRAVDGVCVQQHAAEQRVCNSMQRQQSVCGWAAQRAAVDSYFLLTC